MVARERGHLPRPLARGRSDLGLISSGSKKAQSDSNAAGVPFSSSHLVVTLLPCTLVHRSSFYCPPSPCLSFPVVSHLAPVSHNLSRSTCAAAQPDQLLDEVSRDLALSSPSLLRGRALCIGARFRSHHPPPLMRCSPPPKLSPSLAFLRKVI